jgi:alginate O-acetyltransferase complex protein AlgI
VLFNSHLFIFLFLPICLLGFYRIARHQTEWALSWLVLCSLFFYGWWNPAYLLLMLASIVANFYIGTAISRGLSLSRKKIYLLLGIILNLGFLAYFKYANFFVDSLNYLGADYHLETIVLPLAISFFTFQQIAYLVDAYQDDAKEYQFLHYCLFVTFFPQLIAGPIVHHREMLPQFLQAKISVNWDNIAIGLAIFSLGLFKKVILADGVAEYATPVFSAAETGVEIGMMEAWGGSLAYTLQLYFDFSGYSDMAIGLARLFGITLPINFFSPYKALNIIEFWRRWHITLSRFLRDYLYFPLGGNRKGKFNRYRNLMLTMLLGGLWHGAGWTYVLWGGLHGLFLIINHAWRSLTQHSQIRLGVIGRVLSYLLTFLCVVVAWVFFRAESLDSAFNILGGMIGLNGVYLAVDTELWLVHLFQGLGIEVHLNELSSTFIDEKSMRWIGWLLVVVWFMPNTLQLMQKYQPAINLEQFSPEPGTLQITLNQKFAVLCSLIFIYCVLSLTRVSEFLYFQF